MRGANVGEVEGALIYHYYFFGDRHGTGESSDKITLHYFGNQDPGAFVSISGGGVLASSSHPDAAQAFLAFVTGPRARRSCATATSFEYADRQRRRGQSGAAPARPNSTIRRSIPRS